MTLYSITMRYATAIQGKKATVRGHVWAKDAAHAQRLAEQRFGEGRVEITALNECGDLGILFLDN